MNENVLLGKLPIKKSAIGRKLSWIFLPSSGKCGNRNCRENIVNCWLWRLQSHNCILKQIINNPQSVLWSKYCHAPKDFAGKTSQIPIRKRMLTVWSRWIIRDKGHDWVWLNVWRSQAGAVVVIPYGTWTSNKQCFSIILYPILLLLLFWIKFMSLQYPSCAPVMAMPCVCIIACMQS